MLADRASLAGAAKDWTDRVDVITAATAEPPADAVLIRPDGYVAWAADTGTAAPADGCNVPCRPGPARLPDTSSPRTATPTPSWESGRARARHGPRTATY